jgi:hypothetical protein
MKRHAHGPEPRYYIATRANGFRRWVTVDTAHTRAEADGKIRALKCQDDPMWASAEYLVSDHRNPSREENGMIAIPIHMTDRDAAIQYAANLGAMTGIRRLVFKVPEGTAAHEQGIRFGTCEESERAAYAEESPGLEWVTP